MAERIPPNQTVTEKFPVLHEGKVPEYDMSKWRFEVAGEVENALKLKYGEIKELPNVVEKSDFHCVTGWSRLDNKWEGVRLSTIAELARVKPNAKYVFIEADYEYTTNITLEQAMRPDVLLAWRLDGKVLANEHGYPLRLVVPELYAYKSAKWVRKLHFLDKEVLGYWEKRGYSNNADPWKEERYSGFRL